MEPAGQPSDGSEMVSDQKETVEAPPEDQPFPVHVETCGETPQSFTLQMTARDAVQEIKLYLADLPDTCFVTSYDLYIGDVRLPELAELAQLPEVVPDVVIKMRPEPYDERSIRQHVRRTRELLRAPNPAESDGSPSAFFHFGREDEGDEKSAGKDKDQSKKAKPGKIEGGAANGSAAAFAASASLSELHPPPAPSKAALVKRIVYSGWNPPPARRRLAGDLAYLELDLVEGQTLSVTGSVNGFYVNRCGNGGKSFDPLPAKPDQAPFNTLVELLSKFSAAFKDGFPRVVAQDYSPYEMMPLQQPVYPWARPDAPHTFDACRSDDHLVQQIELDVRAQGREWNEEYQMFRDMPVLAPIERFNRDKMLYRIGQDFVEVATRGAIMIVDHLVPPSNPLEPEKMHMFNYQGIFFSFVTDAREMYKEFGGEEGAHVTVNNDMHATRLLNALDVEGIHTILQCVVDYQGHRILAQSPVPGILSKENAAKFVYGSLDSPDMLEPMPFADPLASMFPGLQQQQQQQQQQQNDENVGEPSGQPSHAVGIISDEKFHEAVLKMSRLLHIQPHVIVDTNTGKEYPLALPFEAKGILGSDNRRYVMEVARVTARDMNYQPAADEAPKRAQLAVLRSELVMSYVTYHRDTQKRKDDAANPPKEPPKDDANLTDEERARRDEERRQDDERKAREDDEKYWIGLNPNVFAELRPHLKLGGSAEDIARDEARVRDASKFLVDMVIPSFIEDIIWMSPPQDGQTLTNLMHRSGINCRYLGRILKTVNDLPNPKPGQVARLPPGLHAVKELLVREIYARASKHVLRSMLRAARSGTLAETLAAGLNGLFAPSSNKELRDRAYAEAERRFRISLAGTLGREYVGAVVRTMPTVRSVCLKLGIQLNASRSYDLSSPKAFSPDDIVRMFPLIKHAVPDNSDVVQLMEYGKLFSSQKKFDTAHELFNEALSIVHMVHGAVHHFTANIHQHLASVLYDLKDYTAAFENQARAVVVFERVAGLDNPMTATSYFNLGLFAHAIEKTSLAVHLTKRAVFLRTLASGPNHPEVAAGMMNLGLLMQEAGQSAAAISVLEASVQSFDNLFGASNTLHTAKIFHALAVAHSSLGDHRTALAYEKRNNKILSETFGEADVRTVESNIHLKQYTQKAVQTQIDAYKQQQQQASRGSRTSLLPTPSAASSVEPSAAPLMGSRPLSEVLSFINGAGSSFMQRNAKKTPQRKPAAAKAPAAPAGKASAPSAGKTQPAAPPKTTAGSAGAQQQSQQQQQQQSQQATADKGAKKKAAKKKTQNA